jgi:hypothetical protein
MYFKVEQFFYYSAGIFLFLILFLVQPSQVAETGQLQEQVQKEFAAVFSDLVKKSEPLADLGLIFNGVDEFYIQSSQELMALLEIQDNPAQVEMLIDHVAFATAQLFDLTSPINDNYPVAVSAAPLVRTELSQLVPDISYFDASSYVTVEPTPSIPTEQADLKTQPEVAGSSTDWSEPANNATKPWVTLRDNVTGRDYCVSIYNDEVNKYQGECKYDYY